jgi:hypothetical protein
VSTTTMSAARPSTTSTTTMSAARPSTRPSMMSAS